MELSSGTRTLSCRECGRVVSAEANSLLCATCRPAHSTDAAPQEKPFLRLRPDLILQPVEEGGTGYWVIKDPADNRFFRVKALEYFLITQFDGKTSLEEIRRRASEERRVLVTYDVLNRFAEKFVSLGLLESASGAPHGSASRRPARRIGRLFFFKLPLANPESLLDRLYAAIPWMFRPAAVVIMIATILLGLALAVVHWQSLSFGLSTIASLEGLLLIYLTVTAVTLLHELAHGLTCRHFGGRVQDMGFLLMYFVPCFYCNVSDTYLFKEKRQRLWVVFSGGFFELFLWALAVIGWRVVAPETLVSRVLFVIIGVSGVKALFNFNPLIKLDGYYLLADALGIANLRKEALAGLGRLVRRRLLGLEVEPPRADLSARQILALRGDRFLTVFGAASVLYTVALVGVLVAWGGGWVFEQFGSSALGFYVVAMVGLLHKPAATAAETTKEVGREKWEQLGRQRRRRRTVVLWILLLLVVALFPWQLRIPSELQVLPQNRATVRAPSEGRIARIHFEEGERVQKGDLLVEYDPKELALEKRTKEAELARAREELRLLEKRNPTWQEEIRVQERALETARARELAARREFERSEQLFNLGLLSRDKRDRARSDLEAAESERRRQEAQMALVSKASPDSRIEQMEMVHLRDPEAQRAVIARLEAELAQLDDLLARTRIYAPISGTLTTYRFEEKLGEYLEEGDFVCEIVDDDRVVIEMQVPEKEIDAVRLGYPVKFKVRGYPHRSFYAKVAEIAPVATRDETISTILLRATVDNPDHVLKPGMTGIAKVYCGRTVVAHVLSRDLIRFVRTEFWL